MKKSVRDLQLANKTLKLKVNLFLIEIEKLKKLIIYKVSTKQ